jgi:hypothetical protein
MDLGDRTDQPKTNIQENKIQMSEQDAMDKFEDGLERGINVAQRTGLIRRRRKTASPLATVFIGIVLLIVGASIATFIKGDVFSCSRSTNLCVIEKEGVITKKRTEVISYNVNEIRGAFVDSYRDRDSDGHTRTMYSTNLEMSNGRDESLFSSSSTSRSSHQSVASEVNRFFYGKVDEIEVKNNNLIIFLIGILFAILGPIIIISGFKRMGNKKAE